MSGRTDAIRRIMAMEADIRQNGGPDTEAAKYFNTAARRWMDQCRRQQELTDILKEARQ